MRPTMRKGTGRRLAAMIAAAATLLSGAVVATASAKERSPQAKAAASAPADGLLAAYDFSSADGATLKSSTGDNDATIQGGGTVSKGSLAFTGNTYVKLPDNLLKGKTAATVTIEAKPDAASLDHNNFLWNLGGYGTSNNGGTGQFFVQTNGHRATITKTNWQSENSAVAGSDFAADQWQSIIATIAPNADGKTNTITLYVNGTQVAQKKDSDTGIKDLSDHTRNLIGYSAYAEDAKFTGAVSNFRVYDRALDADEAATVAKADQEEAATESVDPATLALEETGGITAPEGDSNAVVADDPKYGKVVRISGGWIGGSATDGVPTKAVATFADPSAFQKDAWTLQADVRMTDINPSDDSANKSPAFTIGTKTQAINLLLGAGKLGYGTTEPFGGNKDGGYSEHTVAFSTPATVGEWASLAVVYDETADSGRVAVYLNGEQVVAPTAIGFKLSEQKDTKAFLGHGFNSSFVLNGTYDYVTVTAKAASADEAKAATAQRLAAKQKAEAEENIPGKGEHGNNGYLWFNFKATDYEKANYGYSADGYTWKMLNDGNPILANDKGTKGLRDPHLLRLQKPDKDGNKYVMLGTDLHAEGSASGGSWDQINASKYLVVAKSKDLVTWSDPQLVSTGLEGKVGNAWAPEAIWDPQTEDYLVYWSSRDLSTGGSNPTTGNTSLKVYKAHTTDFESFKNPTVWIDQSKADGHNIIDTTIVQGDDGDYYRFSTSDWWTTIDVASSLDGDWTRLVERDSEVKNGTSSVTGDKVVTTTDSGLSNHIEGLTVYQLNSGKWMVMGDNGGYRGFTIDRLSDLKKGGTFTAASGVTFSEKFRHGTVMELTAEEQKAVLDAYGSSDSPATPVTPDEPGAGPIAQYDFDDADNPGKDSKGHYDLTLKGRTSTPDADATDVGPSGKVLHLDGGSTSSEAYAEFPKGMFDGRNKLTVQMDVKSEVNANQFTFTFGQNSTKYYFMKYNTSGELASRITTDSYQHEDAANATLTGSGAWHKVTIVLDDNVMTVYADGAKVAENTATNNKVTDLGRNMLGYLGKSFYNDPYFKGSFDNVTVWNRALSAEEVAKASPIMLQDITVGTKPAAGAEADALKGTDDHTLVHVAKDDASHTVSTVLNRRGEKTLTKTPVTLTFNRGADEAVITMDGKAFTSGDTVDMSQDHTLAVELDGAKQEWTLKAAEISNNPVLPGQYADPDIDYFPETGRFWIYPTTDGFSGWSGNYFHAWSSPDLVNWTDEGVILDVNAAHATDNPNPADYAGSKVDNIAFSPWSTGSAWAPTIEAKDTNNDGKNEYYFYYCAKKSNGTSYIGVAKADSPAGPFKPASDALVSPNMEGVQVGQAIDPSIFTDDDGTSYILYGNGSGAIAQLGDDMMSIVPGTVRRINGLKNFRESVVVAKRDGVYHWTWTCDDAGSENYHVEYGTSTSLFKADGSVADIAYHGVLLEKSPADGLQGTGHQSDVHVKDGTGRDRWFMAYHRHYTPLGVFSSGLGYHRETSISEITFGKDGLMQKIDPTKDVEPIQMQKTDFTKLAEAVEAAKALKEKDYTADSWAEFQKSDALKDAKKVLATKDDTVTAYQTEVDAAATALKAAMDKLVKAEPEPEPEPVPVTSVTISGKGVADGKLSLAKDATAVLTATVKPDDATDKTLTWSSSDEDVVSVTTSADAKAADASAKATLTAHKAGTATITAKAADGSKVSASIEVTVTDSGSEQTTPEVDKSQLQSLVDAEAKADRQESAYTVASWKAYADALDAAQTVLANPNATQDQVNAALGTLRNAIDGLSKAGATPSPTPGKGEESAKPETKPESGSTAATGAAVANVVSAMCLLAAAGIALTVWRRRRA